MASALYELVDQRRAHQGLTWSAIHRKSGVSRSTVFRWRTAVRPPQAGTVLAVADALGIDHEQALHLGGVIVTQAERPGTREPESHRQRVRRLQDELREATEKMMREYGHEGVDDKDVRQGEGSQPGG
ncbi:MAG: helix-turn-helix domain-containing protein [Streptosporangiaceae bacterium]